LEKTKSLAKQAVTFQIFVHLAWIHLFFVNLAWIYLHLLIIIFLLPKSSPNIIKVLFNIGIFANRIMQTGRDLLHLLKNTFDRKHISANPSPNLIPKAQ